MLCIAVADEPPIPSDSVLSEKAAGIKGVLLMSMFAWVLRFGFFGLGNTGDGLWLLVISCIVYGIAFDFFNVHRASCARCRDKKVGLSAEKSRNLQYVDEFCCYSSPRRLHECL